MTKHRLDRRDHEPLINLVYPEFARFPRFLIPFPSDDGTVIVALVRVSPVSAEPGTEVHLANATRPQLVLVLLSHAKRLNHMTSSRCYVL